MSRLVAATVPGTVGDVVTDIQGLVALTQHNQSGGLTGYLQQIYQEFGQLPDQVRTMQGQIARVAPILEDAKADTTMLMTAQRDLAQITATLPLVQQKVRQLTAVLSPVLPQIQAGDVSPDTLTTLALHGGDVVGTYNAVHDLFALRDDAQTKIRSAVTNPNLSPTIAEKASAAYAAAFTGGLSWPMVGLIGVMGYIAFRVFRGKGV
jgi:hypothetical protein